jgi:hypothetical protein
MSILPGTALTAGELIRDLTQRLGDQIATGVSDSGSTTTLVDAPLTNSFPSNDDEGIKGAWIYGISGTAAAIERRITGYTAATGTVTWTVTTTSPSNNTGYVITRFRPTMLLAALQAAQRDETDDGRERQGISLDRVVGREAIIGNLVPNGAFDLYTTANVPDALTLDTDSTFTQENAITDGNRRSLKIVTDGTNAGFVRFAIPRWGKFKGRSVQCYAKVRSNIAARTTLAFADGVLTTTDTVTTANVWELLTFSHAFSDAATQAQVSVEVSAGAAVTVYLQILYVADPDNLQEEAAIDADRNLVWIGKLRVSTQSVLSDNGHGYVFANGFGNQNFHIMEDTEDTPRQLRLDVAGSYRGRVLEYEGYKNHAELTGPTISYTGDVNMLLARAKQYVLAWTNADFTAVEIAKREADSYRGIQISANNYRRVFS